MQKENAWKFPATFWTANIVEFFERSAYYAMFIAITLYLSRVVGFSDVNAAWIGGAFSAGLYFLPTFTGTYADKIGFRAAIILAFTLLTIGYFSLGAFPFKAIVIPSLVVVMIGGSFIKSVITGTVAKSSTAANRAKAFSIFYGMVNVGSFIGKTVAYPIRINLGLEQINYYAAFMSFLALIVVFFFYKSVDRSGEGKSISEIWKGLVAVTTNVRLLLLILIVTGFWIIQHQLYATMPKYVLRMVGEHASPEWIANVNPFIVMSLVVVITNLMKKRRAIVSMNVGMLLMPLSALCMASGHILMGSTGSSVDFGFFSAHPITVMMIVGIAIQGLAECFISPRYLEYFSLHAPKGEEGLYLGFSHLHSFLSSVLGFGISGYLLEAYCPDPSLPQFKGMTPEQMAPYYANAHYIWYFFAAIGLTAAIALYFYRYFFDENKKRAATAA
ncbi:MAG: MFS transporter [Chloroflexota bacterium]